MTRRPTTPTGAAAVLLLAAALGVLSACGTTEEPSVAEEPAAAASAACAEDVATSAGPVTLTDAFGRTVEMDRPAERVAVLEWQQTEDVLSLCLTPVAVADPAGYATWSTAETLPDGIEDVGMRGEPNLDALFRTDPDLVVIEAYAPDDPIIEQLERYDVPVLATKGADAADPIGQMRDTFELIAEATGREERATEVLDEFDRHLAEARTEVAEADTETSDFVYVDGEVAGGNVALRLFGQGSWVAELGEELGLTNAWTAEVDPSYGLGQTDVEGMSVVGDATLFHTGTVDPVGDVWAELEKNRVWKALPAVEQGRYHAFPEGIWTLGAPRSGMQVVDAYVDLIAG